MSRYVRFWTQTRNGVHNIICHFSDIIQCINHIFPFIQIVIVINQSVYKMSTLIPNDSEMNVDGTISFLRASPGSVTLERQEGVGGKCCEIEGMR